MSRENYSSEPEEFIASLKEKLEERDQEIRELKQVIILQKGVIENAKIS